MAIQVESTVEDKTENPEQKKILEEALERFKLAEEAFSDIKRDALDDMEFASGNQWPADIKAQRQADRRPCLTINRLPQQLRQVTNDQRQNRPSLKAHPVDDKADIETAQIYSGLIRHIEYNSNADSAYDTGFEGAARGGFGYWRVITDYVSPMSFEQEILIKRILNPLSVSFDPYSKEPDGSDANFAFISEQISKDEFQRLYPNAKLSQVGEWNLHDNAPVGWISDNSVRVAEYFYKEWTDEEIVLLSNSETVLKRDLPEQLPKGVTIVNTRTTKVPAIKWCKLTASEILEETEWLGKYIPIVPVYGEELDINGKRILKGVIRDAKDPQRMLNFWKSAETEAIALAPKAPWIVEEGQLEGYEADWATANVKNHAYLKYKAVSVNNVPIAPPQRQSFEPAVQAITQAAMLAADDVKATTGIYDAALGARSNEQSGVAIQRRNVQSQTSNFHLVDNLARSQKHTGRILIDLIPKVYDTARAAMIMGEDGTPEVIKINQAFERKGKPVKYDLGAGKYDLTIDVGPSFATKRQEAAASMIDVTKAMPQLMGIAGDLIVKNMDWPGAQEFAERIKKMLPPNLQDQPEGQPQIPPQVQAQMQQMTQMVEQLTAKLNEAHDTIDMKRVEIESKERIEFAKIQADIEIAMAKLGTQESIELLRQEISQIEGRLQLLNYNAPVSHQEPEQESAEGPEQEPEPEQSYVPEQPGTDVGHFEGQEPTGGPAPGTPMEGMNHDDPSNLQ